MSDHHINGNGGGSMGSQQQDPNSYQVIENESETPSQSSGAGAVTQSRFRSIGHLITFTLRLNNLLRGGPSIPPIQRRRSGEGENGSPEADPPNRNDSQNSHLVPAAAGTESAPTQNLLTADNLARSQEEVNRDIVSNQLRESTNDMIENGEIDLAEDTWYTYRGIFANICVFLLVILSLTIIVFYIAGWYVLMMHYDDPCDQPLNNWLLGMLTFNLATALIGKEVRHFLYRNIWGWEQPSPHSTEEVPFYMKTTLDGLHFLLVLGVCFSGLYFLHFSKTCSKTAHVLYNWSYIWIHVMLFLIGLRAMLTLCGVAIITIMIAGGVWKTNDAADADTINKIEFIKYEEGGIVHVKDGAIHTGQASECSICFEKYEQDEELKFTVCKHLFHEHCLKNWLKVKRTCPLCRLDLQESLEKKDETEGGLDLESGEVVTV